MEIIKMNSIKTGLFIADLRKKKAWTQSQLAQQLGVTDKAVSRWETGRGFPDISLLKHLSVILEVSVNEIIIGERIEPAQYQKSAEETILKTLTDSKKKIDRMINGALFTCGAILLVFSLLFLGVDTSWVSVYSILGTIMIAIAIFLWFRKKFVRALILAFVTLLVAFGIFEARDYIYVTQYSLPPLYNISILTNFENAEKKITYHKIFFNVVRHNPDEENEFYTIEKH